MNFDTLWAADQPIAIHAVLALGAIVVGGLQFLMPKGTMAHRALGYVWISGMAIVAITSFFINEFRWIGPFGPIHLLSVLVLYTLWQGIQAARTHAVQTHKQAMFQLYIFSLLLAGGFTLMPGRIMHTVLFG